MGEAIIIEMPDRQTHRQRILFAILTFVLWIFWTYLWLPVLPYLAWGLRMKTSYQSFVMVGWGALGDVLPIYLIVIVALGGSLIAWSFYNYFRFRNIERRKARPSVSLDEIGARRGIEVGELERWRNSARLVLGYDSSGELARAAVG